MTHTSAHSGAPSEAAAPRAKGDLVLSIALLLVDIAVGAVMAIVAVLLVVAYDTCAIAVCSHEGFALGWFMALVGPPLVILVGSVVTIVRLRRRRHAFWVPLVTLAAATLLFFGGAQIVFVSVPGAGF